MESKPTQYIANLPIANSARWQLCTAGLGLGAKPWPLICRPCESTDLVTASLLWHSDRHQRSLSVATCRSGRALAGMPCLPCVLQQRHGLSTGLARSVSSSRTATLTRSWKATQTRTVRKAKHTWLDNQRRNAVKRHRTEKSRALIKPTNPPATKLPTVSHQADTSHVSLTHDSCDMRDRSVRPSAAALLCLPRSLDLGYLTSQSRLPLDKVLRAILHRELDRGRRPRLAEDI